MFQYQQTGQYFAQIADGFESLAADELAGLGASRIQPTFRGLRFWADAAVLYAVNYQARLISRVLAPLVSFRCNDRNDLYRTARAIDWPAFFSLDHTLGIFANVSGNDNLRHSKFAALCMKDAVVDAFRERRGGQRPDVDRMNPDVWFNLFIQKNQATISVDTSGGSLHRRGYRRQSVEAPMQETLAAAMVAITGWQGEKPLCDPMCGSGTLLCEALMKLCHIPAGYLKQEFGFRFLPDFDARLWQRVKKAADQKIRPLPAGLLAGSDIDPRAVKATRTNCSMLPGGDRIQVSQADFRNLGALENRIIVCNPPYGIRMQSGTALDQFYKSLGDFLKQRCSGSEAYIYFGNREMIKKIGLRPAWKKPIRNAGLDGRAVKYALY